MSSQPLRQIIDIVYALPDLLKLSDDTDLDILNSSMETIVESFPDELMPVAAQLTARLVRELTLPLDQCVCNSSLAVRNVLATCGGSSSPG